MARFLEYNRIKKKKTSSLPHLLQRPRQDAAHTKPSHALHSQLKIPQNIEPVHIHKNISVGIEENEEEEKEGLKQMLKDTKSSRKSENGITQSTMKRDLVMPKEF